MDNTVDVDLMLVSFMLFHGTSSHGDGEQEKNVQRTGFQQDRKIRPNLFDLFL